jgi:hypothetical protein
MSAVGSGEYGVRSKVDTESFYLGNESKPSPVQGLVLSLEDGPSNDVYYEEIGHIHGRL